MDMDSYLLDLIYIVSDVRGTKSLPSEHEDLATSRDLLAVLGIGFYPACMLVTMIGVLITALLAYYLLVWRRPCKENLAKISPAISSALKNPTKDGGDDVMFQEGVPPIVIMKPPQGNDESNQRKPIVYMPFSDDFNKLVSETYSKNKKEKSVTYANKNDIENVEISLVENSHNADDTSRRARTRSPHHRLLGDISEGQDTTLASFNNTRKQVGFTLDDLTSSSDLKPDACCSVSKTLKSQQASRKEVNTDIFIDMFGDVTCLTTNKNKRYIRDEKTMNLPLLQEPNAWICQTNADGPSSNSSSEKPAAKENKVQGTEIAETKSDCFIDEGKARPNVEGIAIKLASDELCAMCENYRKNMMENIATSDKSPPRLQRLIMSSSSSMVFTTKDAGRYKRRTKKLKAPCVSKAQRAFCCRSPEETPRSNSSTSQFRSRVRGDNVVRRAPSKLNVFRCLSGMPNYSCSVESCHYQGLVDDFCVEEESALTSTCEKCRMELPSDQSIDAISTSTSSRVFSHIPCKFMQDKTDRVYESDFIQSKTFLSTHPQHIESGREELNTEKTMVRELIGTQKHQSTQVTDSPAKMEQRVYTLTDKKIGVNRDDLCGPENFPLAKLRPVKRNCKDVSLQTSRNNLTMEKLKKKARGTDALIRPTVDQSNEKTTMAHTKDIKTSNVLNQRTLTNHQQTLEETASDTMKTRNKKSALARKGAAPFNTKGPYVSETREHFEAKMKSNTNHTNGKDVQQKKSSAIISSKINKVQDESKKSNKKTSNQASEKGGNVSSQFLNNTKKNKPQTTTVKTNKLKAHQNIFLKKHPFVPQNAKIVPKKHQSSAVGNTESLSNAPNKQRRPPQLPRQFLTKHYSKATTFRNGIINTNTEDNLKCSEIPKSKQQLGRFSIIKKDKMDKQLKEPISLYDKETSPKQKKEKNKAFGGRQRLTLTPPSDKQAGLVHCNTKNKTSALISVKHRRPINSSFVKRPNMVGDKVKGRVLLRKNEQTFQKSDVSSPIVFHQQHESNLKTQPHDKHDMTLRPLDNYATTQPHDNYNIIKKYYESYVTTPDMYENRGMTSYDQQEGSPYEKSPVGALSFEIIGVASSHKTDDSITNPSLLQEEIKLIRPFGHEKTNHDVQSHYPANHLPQGVKLLERWLQFFGHHFERQMSGKKKTHSKPANGDVFESKTSGATKTKTHSPNTKNITTDNWVMSQEEINQLRRELKKQSRHISPLVTTEHQARPDISVSHENSMNPSVKKHSQATFEIEKEKDSKITGPEHLEKTSNDFNSILRNLERIENLKSDEAEQFYLPQQLPDLIVTSSGESSSISNMFKAFCKEHLKVEQVQNDETGNASNRMAIKLKLPEHSINGKSQTRIDSHKRWDPKLEKSEQGEQKDVKIDKKEGKLFHINLSPFKSPPINLKRQEVKREENGHPASVQHNYKCHDRLETKNDPVVDRQGTLDLSCCDTSSDLDFILGTPLKPTREDLSQSSQLHKAVRTTDILNQRQKPRQKTPSIKSFETPKFVSVFSNEDKLREWLESNIPSNDYSLLHSNSFIQDSNEGKLEGGNKEQEETKAIREDDASKGRATLSKDSSCEKVETLLSKQDTCFLSSKTKCNNSSSYVNVSWFSGGNKDASPQVKLESYLNLSQNRAKSAGNETRIIKRQFTKDPRLTFNKAPYKKVSEQCIPKIQTQKIYGVGYNRDANITSDSHEHQGRSFIRGYPNSARRILASSDGMINNNNKPLSLTLHTTLIDPMKNQSSTLATDNESFITTTTTTTTDSFNAYTLSNTNTSAISNSENTSNDVSSGELASVQNTSSGLMRGPNSAEEISDQSNTKTFPLDWYKPSSQASGTTAFRMTEDTIVTSDVEDHHRDTTDPFSHVHIDNDENDTNKSSEGTYYSAHCKENNTCGVGECSYCTDSSPSRDDFDFDGTCLQQKRFAETPTGDRFHDMTRRNRTGSNIAGAKRRFEEIDNDDYFCQCGELWTTSTGRESAIVTSGRGNSCDTSRNLSWSSYNSFGYSSLDGSKKAQCTQTTPLSDIFSLPQTRNVSSGTEGFSHFWPE